MEKIEEKYLSVEVTTKTVYEKGLLDDYDNEIEAIGMQLNFLTDQKRKKN